VAVILFVAEIHGLSGCYTFCRGNTGIQWLLYFLLRKYRNSVAVILFVEEIQEFSKNSVAVILFVEEIQWLLYFLLRKYRNSVTVIRLTA